MQKITLAFTQMCCESRVKSIFFRLHQILGVDTVTLDFKAKQAIVCGDQQVLPADLVDQFPDASLVAVTRIN